MQNVALLFQT